MARKLLRDDQWKRIEWMLPGKVGDRGRSGADNRQFVEATLWIARTGSPWRDLPKGFGPWIVCTIDLRAGRIRGYGIVSLRNWPKTVILKKYFWIRRLFEPTSTRPVP